MIANLPLLFADGNPTALSKIRANKLEKFITFMVTCSWGHDTAKEIRQPPWWPSNVPFSHPFVRPREVPEDWELRLKNVVKRCYDYHKSAFLLVFSAQLARHKHKKLRYVDNRDHTTSLYHRPSSRLLVTFRNENLFYDRETSEDVWSVRSRSSSPSSSQSKLPVKAADIYLCDNCDSHFDNFEVFKAHERLCNDEVPSSTCNGGLPEFLSALKLLPVGDKLEQRTLKALEADSKPRNIRSAANIDRGPLYPFSSLAYIKNAKINAPRDTSFSRERTERFCCTPSSFSKNLVSKGKGQFPVRYKRPMEYWTRRHVFPNQRNKKVLDLNAQLLLLKCRPITVDVPRMPLERMQAYIDKLQEEAQARRTKEEKDKDIVFVDADQAMDIETKNGDPLKKVDECEVIDLCSDDETPSVNENCDPRAGVTCVMRGGAVLRRTAATPQALPAEPCGARQRPLPSLILQPHPVILITRTLNNLHAIALD